MSSRPSFLALPINIVERLGLWPKPKNALSISLETGGGVVESYIVPQSVIIRVIAEDRVGGEVIANTVVNPHIDEVLISDALTEELGIQILYPRRGIWKFSDEEKMRKSE